MLNAAKESAETDTDTNTDAVPLVFDCVLVMWVRWLCAE